MGNSVYARDGGSSGDSFRTNQRLVAEVTLFVTSEVGARTDPYRNIRTLCIPIREMSY